MIAGPLRCPIMVGRQRELRRLVELRLTAARGHGALVVLSGEAGVGKSRMLEAFRESLTGGRAALGVSVAREFGNEPYAPILATLAAVGREVSLSPALTLGEQLAALAHHVSDASQRRQTVLVIEDVQWADDGTLRFLHYMLPSLAKMRTMFVLTYRSEEVRAGHPLARYLVRFARNPDTHRILLEPLAAGELRRVVRLAAGQHARLSPALIDDIVERSDGNPLFAEELLGTALEKRATAGSARELPLTIRSAVEERCSSLDDETKAVLFHAAVLGRRFDAGLLARICNRSQTAILQALRDLCRLQIVNEPEVGRTTYTFRHALTREAVYRTMLSEEIVPLHRAILAALEERGAKARDLGYHAAAARDPVKTIAYNEGAGDEAVALHADADAHRCYELALEGTGDDDAARNRILEKAAAAAARAGRAHEAAALYERAALGYEAGGNVARAGDSYLAMSGQARVAGDTIRAREILARAIARLPVDAAAKKTQAKLSIALAFTHLDRAEMDAAERLIARADAVSDSATFASALNYAAAVRGDLDEVRRASLLYVERSRALGPDALLGARFNLGFTLCALGVDAEALEILTALLPGVRERRLVSLEVLTCANGALLHARAGKWDDARALVERALDIPEPATTGPIVLAAAGLTIAAATGDEDLAERSAPPEIIEAAFSSRINSTVGRIGGPYARWLHRRGDDAASQSALRLAIDALAGPFAATETLLAAVELGDAATRSSALEFLPALDAMSELPIYAATSAQLRGCAPEAAAFYRQLHWPLHELQVLERGRSVDAVGLGGSSPLSPGSARSPHWSSPVSPTRTSRRVSPSISAPSRSISPRSSASWVCATEPNLLR